MQVRGPEATGIGCEALGKLPNHRKLQCPHLCVQQRSRANHSYRTNNRCIHSLAAAPTKHRRLAGLEQQKCIFLQSWRLEVQDQSVGRAGFFRGLSPRLVDGCLLPVSSRGHPPCVQVLMSSSFRAPVILEWSPPK